MTHPNVGWWQEMLGDSHRLNEESAPSEETQRIADVMRVLWPVYEDYVANFNVTEAEYAKFVAVSWGVPSSATTLEALVRDLKGLRRENLEHFYSRTGAIEHPLPYWEFSTIHYDDASRKSLEVNLYKILCQQISGRKVLRIRETLPKLNESFIKYGSILNTYSKYKLSTVRLNSVETRIYVSLFQNWQAQPLFAFDEMHRDVQRIPLFNLVDLQRLSAVEQIVWNIGVNLVQGRWPVIGVDWQGKIATIHASQYVYIHAFPILEILSENNYSDKAWNLSGLREFCNKFTPQTMGADVNIVVVKFFQALSNICGVVQDLWTLLAEKV